MAAFPQGFKVALLASNEAIRLAASSVLTACSYKVTPAVSVEDCLQLCTVQRIDIVLAESSDLTLNKEKTQQLTASLKTIPLIVMSDADTPATMFHGLKIGAVDFLKRPLDEAKVRSMWQHTLQKRMNVVPTPGDEGSSHGPRRLQPTTPSDPSGGGTGMGRGSGTGPGFSEGSSNEQKLNGHSTLESPSAPRSEITPETAQNFTSVQRNDRSATERPSDTIGVSSAMGPTVQPHGDEQRKRTHRTSSESQRRKIRSIGGSGSNTHGPVSTTTGTTFPPLLGIPPGCVPPVGSNGLAIGMPFLNQHPFVPTTPMNPVNTFGCMSPFLYTPGGDLDLARGGGVSTPFDPGHFDTPIPMPSLGLSTSEPEASSTSPPLTRPTTSLPRQTEIEGVLHRSASMPVAVTDDSPSSAMATAASTTQHRETDASQRSLRKSPSLVHF